MGDRMITAKSAKTDFAVFMDAVGAVASMAAGAGFALAAAPQLASAVGFKKDGIAAGSAAASWMRASGGATPKGGFVATGQSIGATESVFASTPATIFTGVAGAVAGLMAYQAFKPSSDCKKERRSLSQERKMPKCLASYVGCLT